MTEHARVALVTGASSGIGEAAARRLADDGFAVALVARREQRLQEVADGIRGAGGTAEALPADLGEPSTAAGVVADIRDRFGRLDLLVNNAGFGAWGGILEAELDDLRAELDINLGATVALTHAAAPLLVDGGGGDIVNVSSLARHFPSPDAVGYASAKAGMTHFSHSIAAELRPRGVRVVVIEPAEVATPMQTDEDIARLPMLEPDDVAEAISWVVGLPRHVSIRTIEMLAAPRTDAG